MKVFNWFRWLRPIKKVYINGKEDRVTAFALNFAFYFLLFNLLFWAIGYDPLIRISIQGPQPEFADAGIVERIIHAGDTPLASNCKVTQTGPMELTVSACSWTTTGQARIVAKEKVSNLPNEIAAGRVQMMPGGKRVRGWLRNKDGTIIDKSKTHSSATSTVLTITAGDTWAIYLTDGPGITMPVVLQKAGDPSPANFVDFIVMPFTVPIGTTDLNTIEIEVFTVKPDFPPPRPLFER